MSKVMRSSKPAARPIACAPTTPVDGPGQHGAHRHRRRRGKADDAAVRLGEVRRGRRPSASSRGFSRSM
jgi:hypothetical protein